MTSAVVAKGNGTYSFGGLSVNYGTPHCSVQAVLAGWALVVVYEHASEDFRVVNVFDGFEYYRGSQITLIPSNFEIPTSPINGKLIHLSWEGDVENSGSLNGFDENTYLYYEEDILCEKLNELNLLSALITDETVIHVGASSTSGVSSSWLLKVDLNSMVYYLRNYRNVNLVTILFIKCIRYFHISILNLKD